MIACDLGSLDNARNFLERVKVFSLAESLGGVESLISHPATMTHASVPAEERARLGITDGLVRRKRGPYVSTWGRAQGFDGPCPVHPDQCPLIPLHAGNISERPGSGKANLHATFLVNFFDELRRRVPLGK